MVDNGNSNRNKTPQRIYEIQSLSYYELRKITGTSTLYLAQSPHGLQGLHHDLVISAHDKKISDKKCSCRLQW